MSKQFARGIDVSKHQGIIDWAKVKADGIEFAIIRAGFGNSIRQKDPYFDANIKGALAVGIDVGAYWFSYAYTVEQAKAEAEVFLQVMAPYKGKVTYPLAFDWEYDSYSYAVRNGVFPDKFLITRMARVFMGVLEKAGWYATNYTNIDYYKNKFDMNLLSDYDIWLADYTGGADYSCGMQQTGSTGRVKGIAGNVDTNISMKDYPSIIKKNGMNGFAKTTLSAAESKEPRNVPEWQMAGLENLVAQGIIGDKGYWEPKMRDTITVGEVLGLLTKMVQ